jgi:hypothetical protein
LQNALRLQKIIFFGKDFLCEKCVQPVLKKIISHSGKIEYISVVQNKIESSIDSEILLESFSDEEQVNKKCDVQTNGNGNVDEIQDSPDLKSHHDAAEIRRLLRRKYELERKQKMEEKYNERLQVSAPTKKYLHVRLNKGWFKGDST